MKTTGSITRTSYEPIGDEKPKQFLVNKVMPSLTSFVLMTTPISSVEITSSIQNKSSIKNIHKSTATETYTLQKNQWEFAEEKNEKQQSSRTANVNKLMERNREKEMEKMQNEILQPVIRFERFVTKLGFLLTFLFTLLSLPFFIGYPALVGVIMSMGLPIFVKIRKWERGGY